MGLFIYLCQFPRVCEDSCRLRRSAHGSIQGYFLFLAVFLLGLAPLDALEVLKLFDRKSERAHELAMQDKRGIGAVLSSHLTDALAETR